jgi:hypothetical protein
MNDDDAHAQDTCDFKNNLIYDIIYSMFNCEDINEKYFKQWLLQRQ